MYFISTACIVEGIPAIEMPIIELMMRKERSSSCIQISWNKKPLKRVTLFELILQDDVQRNIVSESNSASLEIRSNLFFKFFNTMRHKVLKLPWVNYGGMLPSTLNFSDKTTWLPFWSAWILCKFITWSMSGTYNNVRWEIFANLSDRQILRTWILKKKC